jgi:glycine/D-amino acid oxidase-like deaminating enzyme
MRGLSLYPHSPDDVIERIVERPQAVPKSADVVVIGGGIMGAASAYYLARRGLEVVVLEKDRVASHQSGRNWGFVRTQYRDPAELPLAVRALELWPRLEEELGHPVGWRRTGCVFAARDEAELAEFETWRDDTRGVAQGAALLSSAEVAAMMPSLRASPPGALYTASDGQAEPSLATTAFALAAEARGAQVLEDCGAMAIEAEGGKVRGVLSEHGFIKAPRVICAAGAISHRFLRALSLTLPQQVVRNTVSLTAPMGPLAQPCFCGFGVGLRQRGDGSCILAAESTSDIDLTLDSFRHAGFFLPSLLAHRKTFALALGRPLLEDLHHRIVLRGGERLIEPRRPRLSANHRRAVETAKLLKELFAGLEEVRVVKSWAGAIDVLPDALPVIDGEAGPDGLVVATGFSGHGFGLGPAVGEAVAAMVAGDRPAVDLSPFRLNRFVFGDYRRPHAPL